MKEEEDEGNNEEGDWDGETPRGGTSRGDPRGGECAALRGKRGLPVIYPRMCAPVVAGIL